MKRKTDSSAEQNNSQAPSHRLKYISGLVASIVDLGKADRKTQNVTGAIRKLLAEFLILLNEQFDDLQAWISYELQFESKRNDTEVNLGYIIKFMGIFLKDDNHCAPIPADNLNKLLLLIPFDWSVSKTLCFHGLANLTRNNRIEGKLATELLQDILINSSRGSSWTEYHTPLLFSLSFLMEYSALDKDVDIASINSHLTGIVNYPLRDIDYRNVLYFYRILKERNLLTIERDSPIIHLLIKSCRRRISFEYSENLTNIFSSIAILLDESFVVGFSPIRAEYINEILVNIQHYSQNLSSEHISLLFNNFAHLAKVGAISGRLSFDALQGIMSRFHLESLSADSLYRFFEALSILQQSASIDRSVSDALITQFINTIFKKEPQITPGKATKCLRMISLLIVNPQVINQNERLIAELLRISTREIDHNPANLIPLVTIICFLRDHRNFDNYFRFLLNKISVHYVLFTENQKNELNRVLDILKDSPLWLQNLKLTLEKAASHPDRPALPVLRPANPVAQLTPQADIEPRRIQITQPPTGTHKRPSTDIQSGSNKRLASGEIIPVPAQPSSTPTSGSTSRGPRQVSSANASRTTGNTRPATPARPASWQNACNTSRIFAAIANNDINILETILQVHDLASTRRSSEKQVKQAAATSKSQTPLAPLLKPQHRPESTLTPIEVEVHNFLTNTDKDALIALIKSSNCHFFGLLLKPCTRHNRYRFIYEGVFDLVFTHLSLVELKNFIPLLLDREVYRSKEAIFHVQRRINLRCKQNPQESSTLLAAELEFLSGSRDFHAKTELHPHLTQELNMRIRNVRERQKRLNIPANQVSSPTTSSSVKQTRSTSSGSFFTPNHSYLYDSEDMIAILKARLEEFNYATVIGVSQMNSNVPGNRIKDQIQLVLRENAALNSSHRITLVIPIQVSNHWIGLLVTITGRKLDSALYLNSMDNRPSEARAKLIMDELSAAGLDTTGKVLNFPARTIQQPLGNHTDCGPCLVENFRCALSQNWPAILDDPNKILEFRRTHIQCLLEKRPDYHPVFREKHRTIGANFPNIQQQLRSHGVEEDESDVSLPSMRH
ncbi:hypothetical protein Lbir_2585 [Legionella birminghamensis]|uniref:Ubiquitin-like protease family profile domain-containing protein n=1 Tax=Legionella birminghamensis TaxID=28083 RepID=A0A378I7V2_9GAMM|nr:hypothetical protein [Legionella birminghamensis]KTC67983.1 hypothetical protein Lbir_2585 [Legionella birminghamensis]STX31308.1 Uncharacterised protein [Legionella birminghamensis]